MVRRSELFLEVAVALYQVICVNKARTTDGSHDHISYLRLGSQAGWDRRITVDEAIRQLRSPAGDRYYTISPSTGARAEVIEGLARSAPIART